jgi:hypothetical protein
MEGSLGWMSQDIPWTQPLEASVKGAQAALPGLKTWLFNFPVPLLRVQAPKPQMVTPRVEMMVAPPAVDLGKAAGEGRRGY